MASTRGVVHDCKWKLMPKKRFKRVKYEKISMQVKFYFPASTLLAYTIYILEISEVYSCYDVQVTYIKDQRNKMSPVRVAYRLHRLICE